VRQHDVRTIACELLTQICLVRYHFCHDAVAQSLPKGVLVLRRALTVAFAVAVIALGCSASALAATAIERNVQSAGAENDLVALINAYRSANGLQQVSPNGALTGAATWMASDMAAKNYIGHVSSDGRSPTQRMSAFGYPAASMYTGEDLGAGFGTAGAVLAGWQASAAHNAVLLNPNYNAVGIGLVYNTSSTYKWYWAADFGGPGVVKIVIPPPTPQPVAPARSSTAPAPVVERAIPAPRGPSPQSALTVDPEPAARDTQIDAIEVMARTIAQFFEELQRTGAI
jgi:uncharacterized protein YkwD